MIAKQTAKRRALTVLLPKAPLSRRSRRSPRVSARCRTRIESVRTPFTTGSERADGHDRLEHAPSPCRPQPHGSLRCQKATCPSRGQMRALVARGECDARRRCYRRSTQAATGTGNAERDEQDEEFLHADTQVPPT